MGKHIDFEQQLQKKRTSQVRLPRTTGPFKEIFKYPEMIKIFKACLADKV